MEGQRKSRGEERFGRKEEGTQRQGEEQVVGLNLCTEQWERSCRPKHLLWKTSIDRDDGGMDEALPPRSSTPIPACPTRPYEIREKFYMAGKDTWVNTQVRVL